MQENKPTVRLYRPGDEAGIVRLFNLVFPTPVDQTYWQWKFANNPRGFPLIVIATEDSMIVGHTCLNPVEMLAGNRVVTAAQAVDMMVEENYRGQRLIAQIANLCLEYLESGYASFSFGFPVPRFQPFSRRVLGWSEVCTMPQAVKLVNVAYVFRRLLRKRPNLLKSARRIGSALTRKRRRPKPAEEQQKPPLTRSTGFDARFDRLWEDVASDFQIAAVRDCRYLSWRYAHPHYVTYTIAEPDQVHGFVVLRTLTWKGWRIGCIADLLARNDNVAQRLLRAALAHFGQDRVDLVRCWMMEHAPYYHLLGSLGFIYRPSPYKLMARTHTRSVPQSLPLEPTRWHLTLGDSDGV